MAASAEAPRPSVMTLTKARVVSARRIRQREPDTSFSVRSRSQHAQGGRGFSNKDSFGSVDSNSGGGGGGGGGFKDESLDVLWKMMKEDRDPREDTMSLLGADDESLKSLLPEYLNQDGTFVDEL